MKTWVKTCLIAVCAAMVSQVFAASAFAGGQVSPVLPALLADVDAVPLTDAEADVTRGESLGPWWLQDNFIDIIIKFEKFKNDPNQLMVAINSARSQRNQLANNLRSAERELANARTARQRTIARAKVAVARFRLNRADSNIRQLNNWLSRAMNNQVFI